MDQYWLKLMQSHFEAIFSAHLIRPNTHSRLINAMRYSGLNGGKRVRPLLCYAAGHIFSKDLSKVDDYACAVEMIHAYSLIHDDLPAMDDDDLRRGKATCHIAFDEATAILAGDGLLTLAFNLLANTTIEDSIKIKLIALLSDCSGINGMLDGQMMDLDSENKHISFEMLKKIHARKTGALIKASILGGALCTQSTLHAQHIDINHDERNKQMHHLSTFSEHLGLAFQIQDDILDIQEDTLTLGKTAGKDREQNKATYPSLLGFAQAKDAAIEQSELALAALEIFDERANYLRDISRYVISRNH